MFDINKATTTPDNFFAGSFPIAKDFGTIKADAVIRARAPIVQGEDGIEEATAGTLANLIGLSADVPSGDEIVYYLTGEFFTQALTMPDGITAETLKPAFRKLGIFLKELNVNV